LKKFLFFLFVPFFLHADFVEVKLGYFYPQDKTFQQLYHHGGFAPFLEADFAVYKALHFWMEEFFFIRNGHEPISQASTSVFLLPISAGLKYIQPINHNWDFYLKGGGNWFYLHTKQNDPYVKKIDHKNSFGATAGTGFLYHISKHAVLDIFFNYLYDKKTFTDPNSLYKIHLFTGGYAAGLGGGYFF
jgi:hypothetical protein